MSYGEGPAVSRPHNLSEVFNHYLLNENIKVLINSEKSVNS